MVSRDFAVPINSQSYMPATVPAATPSSTLAANSSESVPMVGSKNSSVVYLDVRKSPAQKSNEVSRRSPRLTQGMGMASAANTEATPPVLPPNADRVVATLMKLSAANEQTWLAIGSAAETMGDMARALGAYESALLHNPYSIPALSATASVYRSMDHFDLAVEYFQRVLDIDNENGEVWGAMGHCYLMMDELEKAYAAYHRALCYLPNPKEPKLWYGIGILYDRYGSLEHAEETFSSVVRTNPDYEKANEIYFRLGIIYKQQGQYESSLECFQYILNNPPRPLTGMDIWFQIGHVHEQQGAYDLAKEAYEHVLSENTDHAKVLQQLGALYMQPDSGFQNEEKALELLHLSLDSDPNDQQTWYLVGRSYMNTQEYNKAYDAYQQAVYRDGKNPALWCSIGILYFQISQFHDALGAFSRSIRLNPYIPEIWLNLGILYETCNNQTSDAIDAYRRTLELEPENTIIQQRLQLLQNAEPLGKAVPNIPLPKDIPFAAYATVGPVAPSTPPPNVAEADETTWSATADPIPVRDIPVEDERKHALESSTRHAYESHPRMHHASLSSYGGGTYSDYARHAATVHPSRMYSAPSEWDRQYAVPYADERVATYSTRLPSSKYPYDGRAMRYELNYQNGRSYHLPAASTPPLSRRVGAGGTGPVSPSREHDRMDMEQDNLIRRKRDIPNLRSSLPSRLPSTTESWAGETASEQHYPLDRGIEPPARNSFRTSGGREVDEDYDEGAASALMGLAGAAASAYEATSWARSRPEAVVGTVSRSPPLSVKRGGETDRPALEAKRRRNDEPPFVDERLDMPDPRSVHRSVSREQ